MIGFPYDDLEGWRGTYPTEVFEAQFQKAAWGWMTGLKSLREAAAIESSPALDAECRVAETACLHFQSVANQIAFVRSRGSNWTRCAELLRSEITLARRLFDLVSADSRIGFEASNHYYYTRLDLVEKILNCRNLLATIQ